MAPSWYSTGTVATNVNVTGGIGTWLPITSSPTITSDWITISTGDIDWGGNVVFHQPVGEFLDKQDGQLVVPHDRQLRLPDGTVIHIDAVGNFRIEDKDAQVIYQANRQREFNPYVNAGDLVARFIDYLRTIKPGIRKHEIPTIPLQSFVHWLIIEAAERDGDPVPADVEHPQQSRLLAARTRPQCLLPVCRRFVRRDIAARGFTYCNPQHAELHHRLLAA